MATLTHDEYWAPMRAHLPSDKAGNLLLTPAMGRLEYEALAAAVGIATTDDDTIAERDRRRWYSDGFAPHDLTWEVQVHHLHMILDSRRAWGIAVEHGQYTVEVTPNRDPEMAPRVRFIPTPRPSVAQVQPQSFGACSLCGMSVPRTALMTSPRGPVCPDCYDEAEGG